MADITLAEFNGQTWLVGGEAHIDDLLANTLPAGISIELVACERKADVHDLWVRLCGETAFAGDPWQIHPAIAKRILRGLSAAPDFAVLFPPWSVMPDDAGLRVLAEAAAWASGNPEQPVVLAEYLDPDAPPTMADLAVLRLRVIEDELAKTISRARLVRTRRPLDATSGVAAGGGRIDILMTVTDAT